MEPETPDVPVGEPEGSSAEAEVAIEEEKVLAVEDLLTELEAVIAQRDEYLALAQAKQAEFENFRKRMMKQQADELARASSKLVEALLPVLDAFDYGVAHGDESLAPMRAQLLGVLVRQRTTCRQASRNTRAPSAPITPDSSASGMKSAGSMKPSTG